jgi:hypothetical protein
MQDDGPKSNMRIQRLRGVIRYKKTEDVFLVRGLVNVSEHLGKLMAQVRPTYDQSCFFTPSHERQP